jgi:hypothetical protein
VKDETDAEELAIDEEKLRKPGLGKGLGTGEED